MKTTQKTLKALSLWQPWASLILLGYKHFETRSWFTDYRGSLVIHAAKKHDGRIQDETAFVLQNEHNLFLDWEDLPLGKALCICDLADCIPITPTLRDRQTQLELDCGNWALGRWAWRLDNVRAIDPAIPIKGHQRLWNINPSILEQ